MLLEVVFPDDEVLLAVLVDEFEVLEDALLLMLDTDECDVLADGVCDMLVLADDTCNVLVDVTSLVCKVPVDETDVVTVWSLAVDILVAVDMALVYARSITPH